MKNISSTIRDQVKAYLTFNYAERRGLMVLVVLIILTEGVNAVLPKLIKKEAFDESVFRENVRQFELALSRPLRLTPRIVIPTSGNNTQTILLIRRKFARSAHQ